MKFRQVAKREEFQEPFTRRGVPVVDPQEAIEFFRGRIPLASKTLEALVERARERGVAAGRDFLRRLQDLIQAELRRGLEEGISTSRWIAEVNDLLKRIGLDAASPHNLNLIYRNNLNTARNAGKWEIAQNPAVRQVFQFGIYRTVGNGVPGVNNVRPEHAKMHMKAYRLDDPIWDTWWPPNGHG